MSVPARPLSLWLYAVGLGAAEPLAPWLLARRARQGKEDPVRIGERLGHASLPRPPGPLVWLHGVSVGETTSLLPLVDALRAQHPGVQLLVTSGTRTSAELLAGRLPPGVIHQYVPVDAPLAVNRFLDHWRPSAGILVEGELWPNLILGAQAKGVRLALVSARMTAASAKGWSRAPDAAHALLDAFDVVLPQDPASTQRLASLGARVGSSLNLKRLGAPLPCDPAELERLKAAIGARPVVLAASTHAGEEEIVVEAFRQATADQPAPLLIVAPRHPDRGPQVADLLTAAGFKVARRAAGEAVIAQTTAYVADTLGEMGLFFRLASVVIMGGAFLPGIGGHNPLEPARLGAAILTGPDPFNAADLYGEMTARVAAIQAADGAELARDLKGLLTYPNIARRMGEAALTYVEAQAHALDDAMAQLRPLLPAPLLPA